MTSLTGYITKVFLILPFVCGEFRNLCIDFTCLKLIKKKITSVIDRAWSIERDKLFFVAPVYSLSPSGSFSGWTQSWVEVFTLSSAWAVFSVISVWSGLCICSRKVCMGVKRGNSSGGYNCGETVSLKPVLLPLGVHWEPVCESVLHYITPTHTVRAFKDYKWRRM